MPDSDLYPDPAFHVIPDPDPTLKPDLESNWQLLSVHHRTAARLLKQFQDFLYLRNYGPEWTKKIGIKYKFTKITGYTDIYAKGRILNDFLRSGSYLA